MNSNQRITQKIIPYLYVLPAALIVLVFFISSSAFTFYASFTDWSGLNKLELIGITNYIELFKDGYFVQSLINTVIWVFAGLIIPVLIPLVLAILITKTRFTGTYKNIFYLPNAVSPTIGALIMTALLSNYGIPKILGMMGFESLDTYWLGIPYVNTLVMIGASVWQGIGVNLILLVVGLNNIPSEPVEAAQIDGASGFSLYSKVVFPLLKPTLVIVILMSIVNSFKTFDIIWLMTNGGPYRTSETLAVTMYKETFVNGNYGYGAAVATILSIIVLFISWFYLKKTFEGEEN
ncbi:carbohydrate ABC transporter permease [Lederbergia ruris]|uniref:ABC transporter permease protein YurN n=1 Tax=Lederbergia ruris TaxID=217495 RepID=A0ABQ4KPC7_9BACI|nr:sugar ABC transporter permease [Lederbergia ruris]GIN59768.1 putative ABC transporter permease protein YurN [Lederbergia ruris]